MATILFPQMGELLIKKSLAYISKLVLSDFSALKNKFVGTINYRLPVSIPMNSPVQLFFCIKIIIATTYLTS